MSRPVTTDYTSLATPQHADKPDFMSVVAAVVSPCVDLSGLTLDIPEYFDLDVAVGVQLDVVGEWVGLSRYITVPLNQPWFSLGVSGRGLGEGIWKGPLTATTGISPLDDDTYRMLLRAKIAANSWDGLTESIPDVLNTFFSSRGVSVAVEDRQDMTLNLIATGTRDIISLSVMVGEYIPVKPLGVRTSYIISSEPTAPVFGLGVESDAIGGLGHGAWSTTPEAYLESTS